MLSSSYAAVEQFESQIFDINTLKELKTLLKLSKIMLSIHLISPTIWMLDWDVVQGCFSGTLELRLEPQLTVGQDIISMRPTTFRLEDPSPTSILSLEGKLIGLVKQSIESIS